MIYEKLFFLLFLLQGSFSSKNQVVAMITNSAEKNLNLYTSWKRNDTNSSNNKNAVQYCDGITEQF